MHILLLPCISHQPTFHSLCRLFLLLQIIYPWSRRGRDTTRTDRLTSSDLTASPDSHLRSSARGEVLLKIILESLKQKNGPQSGRVVIKLGKVSILSFNRPLILLLQYFINQIMYSRYTGMGQLGGK